MAPLSYRVLLSEKNFLRVAQRARALPNGTNLIGIYYTENKLIFKTRSASRPKIIWTQVIEITDLAAEKILSATSFKDVQDLILNSGLRIHCDCPAWKFWGYQYIATKNDYQLIPEYRRPVVRNPYQKGHVCVLGDTLILTSLGLKPIKEIKEGDFVYTRTGTIKAVKHVFELESDDVYELNLSTHKVFATGEHEFLAPTVDWHVENRMFDKVTLKYKRVDGLHFRSKVVRLIPMWQGTVKVDKGFAFLAGLYAADGTATYAKVKGKSTKPLLCDGVSIQSVSVALSKSRWNAYQEVFEELGINWDAYSQNKNRKEDSQVFFFDPKLITNIVRICGCTSKKYNSQKRISDEVYSWDFESIKYFLQGYFAGDGTYNKSLKNSISLNWLGSNKQMILTIYSLLHFIGKVSLTKSRSILCASLLGVDAYNLYKEFEFAFKIKGYSYDFVKSSREVFVNSNVAFEDFRNKGKLEGIHKVYTLEVEDDESYVIGGGFVSKNCKHLFLALSVFPFWAPTIASKYLKHYKQPNQDITEQVGDSQKKTQRPLRNPYGVKPLE